MSDEPVVVRRISWRDLAPWLVLFRVFRVSVSFPALLLAAAGTLLTPIGWVAGEAVWLKKDRRSGDERFETMVDRNGSWPKALLSYQADSDSSSLPMSDVPTNVAEATRVVFAGGPEGDDSLRLETLACYWTYVEPLRLALDQSRTFGEFAYLATGLLWTLLVWGFFGAALTRMAVMRLGREERIGLMETCRDASRKFFQYLAAPLFPLSGVVLLVIPIAFSGLIMRMDVGVFLAGLCWGLVMLGGLVMVVSLIGVFFGWPLMWSAISAEGSDAFDAVSRSFAYVFQRPLHYLFYAIVAALIGGLGWLVVQGVCAGIEHLSWWAASWGMGRERLVELQSIVATNGQQQEQATGILAGGAWLIRAWLGLLHTIVAAFTYSFFWCSAGAIYLLLRMDVDRTEMDEVYVDDLDDAYALPPIHLDNEGAPSAPEQLSGEDPQQDRPIQED